jgi:long-chain acyl-CoA synthetase
VLVDHFLERAADICPDKTAIVCAGGRWSYGEIEHRSRRIARALVDAGLERGDRVVICLENGIEAIVSLFGALKAGGAFVLVSTSVRSDRLSHVLNHSGARALIARHRHLTALYSTEPDLPGLETVVVVGDGASVDVPRGVFLTRFETVSAERHVRGSMPPHRLETDLAALVYTSGSTGDPKGVMLTHRNLTTAADAICTYLENTADDVILNALPLSFTYGLGQITTAFRCAATVVLEPSFVYPQTIIDALLRERVTGLPLVPTMATLLLRHDLRACRFPHLRYITNAAAALPAPKIARLREAFPAARLFSMYGLTECQRACYLPPDQIERRPASVGIAIPGTAAYVVDGQNRPVPAGTTGELVVEGPHVMAGYWNDPVATSRILRRNSRSGEAALHTGDLFRTDDEGYLYFVERGDDIIKTRGEKVAPRHVEEVLAALPGVAEVAVFGVPDDLLGEAVAAAITLVDGAQLTAARVRQHCRRHLEEFMVPTIVDIRDAMPTTATGKVSRRQLRAMAVHAGGPAA